MANDKNDMAGRLSSNYKASSVLEAAIEYFIFYEMCNETPFPEQSGADSEIGFVRECFNRFANGEGAGMADMIGKLDDARNIIIEKMQVLTAYIDRFIVYEYVMNRVEARYTMPEQELEDMVGSVDKDEFTAEIVDYAFQPDVPAEVNERIREVVGQLPVRMSRSKFFNYVKDSIKLYSDSDRESLDGYLYMLRTSAMIYEPEGMQKYFTGFKKISDELAETDYSAMEADYYYILSEKIKVTVSRIQDISDLYMSLQKMINGLYVYALNEGAVIDNGDSAAFGACIDIISAVNRAFDGGYEPDADMLFKDIEGTPEKMYGERTALEMLLGKEIAPEDERYAALKKSEKLMSASVFADLNGNVASGPVTVEYLEEVTDRILDDMQALIKKCSRPIARAVYAAVLGNIPVFFGNSEEFAEYVRHSVCQCGDKAELAACYSLFSDLFTL